MTKISANNERINREMISVTIFRLKTSLTQAENQLQAYQTQTDVKDTEVKSLMVKHDQVSSYYLLDLIQPCNYQVSK